LKVSLYFGDFVLDVLIDDIAAAISTSKRGKWTIRTGEARSIQTEEFIVTTVRILTVIAIFQGLTLVTLWKGDVGATAVHASVPEPGADRREMISELKAMNEKLSSVEKILSSGKLQVEVINPDDKKAR
jgi:hypothetical protein